MSFGLELAIRGDLQAFIEADKRAYAKGVTSVVRRKTRQLDRGFKRHISSAGFKNGGGRKLSKDIVSRVYPRRGPSSHPAGQVTTRQALARKAGKANGRHIDLIEVFSQDTTIRPRRSRWIYIPTLQGQRLGGAPGNAPHELSPRTFKGGGLGRFKDLKFIPSRDGRTMRVVLAEREDVTVFIGVRSSTLRRRLNLLPIYTKVGQNIPELAVRAWERELQKEIGRLRR